MNKRLNEYQPDHCELFSPGKEKLIQILGKMGTDLQRRRRLKIIEIALQRFLLLLAV